MMTNWLQSLLRRLGLAEQALEQTRAPAHPQSATGATDTVAPDSNMGMMDPAFLSGMVRAAMGTRDDEMDCDECYAQVDAFVELHLKGMDAATAYPLVEDHLQRCPPCREEFEALLVALAAETLDEDSP